jgi:deoxyribose-phosphate aldolase
MIPSERKLRELLALAQRGKPVDPAEISWLPALIDHTQLKPEAGEAEIRQLCAEAREFGFATVCVYPRFIPLCRKLLAGSGVKAIAVIGFPTGLESRREKVMQAQDTIAKGAQEIDMVINTAKLRQRKLRAVYLDMRQVIQAAGDVPVKVILETCLLSEPEKILACGLAAAGAAFVKTSTGFGTGGATAADVSLMRSCVGPKIGVKASGGIRDLAACLEMVLAGADRIGASAGAAILGGPPGGRGAY